MQRHHNLLSIPSALGGPLSRGTIMRAHGAYGGGFSPEALFAAGEQGAWYDPSDLSTMFQDSAGTTPAVVGQPVGLVLDKSGRGNHATQSIAASKPTLQQDGSGNYYLAFDGVDDFLSTAAIDFTGTDEMSVFAGVRKLSDAATGMVAELSASYSNPGTFGITAPSTTSNDFGWHPNNGTTWTNVRASGFASPSTAILVGRSKATANEHTLRVNGSLMSTSPAEIGDQVFGNYPLYIGRRGGSSLPFNGRIYSLIVRGKLTEGDDLTSVEEYVAGKTGVTL